MAEPVLRVVNTERAGETGIHTYRVCLVERDGDVEVTSKFVDYGIDGDALENKWGGSFETWLRDYVKPDMISRHANTQKHGEEAARLKGMEL